MSNSIVVKAFLEIIGNLVVVFYFMRRLLFDFVQSKSFRKMLYLSRFVVRFVFNSGWFPFVRAYCPARAVCCIYNQYVYTGSVPRKGDLQGFEFDDLQKNLFFFENKTFVEKRLIVLKHPCIHPEGKEKGVILAKYNKTFAYLLSNLNLPALLNDYCVVLEPSWSGYFVPEIIMWTKFKNHKILIQCPEVKDYDFIKSIGSNLIPIDVGAGCFVDHRTFTSGNNLKKYDVIYVGLFDLYKRHHVLLRAISNVKANGFRVALVSSSWSSGRREIEEMIRYYGLEGNVDIFMDVSHQDLNILYGLSKVNVLLSLREGANKSIFEGMFCDVPCIVLDTNIGVNRKYINNATGRIVSENKLESALLDFKDLKNDYSPRRWALNNISPEQSTLVINNCLRSIIVDDGGLWKSNIYVKVNSPELAYFDSSLGNSRVSASVVLKRYELGRGVCGV